MTNEIKNKELKGHQNHQVTNFYGNKFYKSARINTAVHSVATALPQGLRHLEITLSYKGELTV